MAAFFSFFTFAFIALIYGGVLISCDENANILDSNKTLFLSTTTLKPPSESSISIPTTSTPTTNSPQVEMIRQCSCTESEECITKAWTQISEYQEICKSNLNYFGNDTSKLVKCFINDKSGGKLLNLCVQAFAACAMPKTTPKLISKKLNIPVIRVKEHEMIESLKDFHICAGNFLKDNILQCFNKKNCGVSYIDFEDVGKLGAICPATKGYYYTITVKALPCLKAGVKHVGKQ
uniref:DUF19 domain-containing protein n=1 Tax=Panagrolaimus superbus TaxID=310955 RepID=A0A914YZS4_9BILA